MKKVVVLSYWATLAISVRAEGFSNLSTGSKIVSSIVFIILIGIITSPIWGLIWYFVRKQKKEKERKECLYQDWKERNEKDIRREKRETNKLKKYRNEGIEVSLAGLYYRTEKAHRVAGELNVGDELDLKVNPSNNYDINAVKVYANGTWIGFIPQTHSEFVSNELFSGKKIKTIVSSTDKDNIPNIWIKLIPY